MRTLLILAGGMAAALAGGMAAALAGCSKGTPPADANRPAAQAAPAGAPKPYIEPAEIYEELSAEYAPCLEKVGDANVDWSRGVIIASGSAKAPSAAPQEKLKAQRGAEAAAYRNALLSARGVRVDSRGIFGDIRRGAVEAEGTVAEGEVLSRDWDAATLTATASVCVPMYGLSGVVRLDGAAVENPPAPGGLASPGAEKEESDLIVIDARGTAFRPCLLPRIVNEKEQVLYEPSELPPGELAQRHAGVCVAPRAGRPQPAGSSHPGGSSQPGRSLARRIWVKAIIPLVTHDPSPNDVMLSAAEESDLFRHADALSLLKAGRLVIIVDGP